MKLTRLFLAIGSLAFLGLTFAPRTWASDFDKRTVLTVHEPIQVPNTVLQPGTYVVKVLDNMGNRHVVQIFNADETEIITTILAIPNERLKVTDGSSFAFWETPPGQPKALRAWFYPAELGGQEFAYPKMKAVAIAAAAHEEVPSTEAKTEPELKTAEVVEVAPPPPAPAATAPEQPRVEIAQAAPPPEPAPEPAVAAAPETKLPKTASPYPLIGLAGLIFLGGFGTLRLIRTW